MMSEFEFGTIYCTWAAVSVVLTTVILLRSKGTGDPFCLLFLVFMSPIAIPAILFGAAVLAPLVGLGWLITRLLNGKGIA